MRKPVAEGRAEYGTCFFSIFSSFPSFPPSLPPFFLYHMQHAFSYYNNATMPSLPPSLPPVHIYLSEISNLFRRQVLPADVALVQVSPPDKNAASHLPPSLPPSLPPKVPIYLSEIPNLFRRQILPVDVALVQVSPPDKHGYCSLGTSVDIMRAGVQCAKHVVGHINAKMPRTLGDGLIHISQFDRVFK